MRPHWATAAVLLTGLIVFGCAKKDDLVVDEHNTIKAGEQTSYALDPGRYKVDITASNDGATVQFIGAPCPGSETGTQTFSTICELQQTGQVIVGNPSEAGTGADCTVTVQITKLAK